MFAPGAANGNQPETSAWCELNSQKVFLGVKDDIGDSDDIGRSTWDLMGILQVFTVYEAIVVGVETGPNLDGSLFYTAGTASPRWQNHSAII